MSVQSIPTAPRTAHRPENDAVHVRAARSKFYGPFASSLPEQLTPILNKYCAVLELDAPSEGPYLFHPPQSNSDRSLEPSAWTGWVRRLFKRHHGTEIAPKTLRSVRSALHKQSCSACSTSLLAHDVARLDARRSLSHG